MLFCDEVSIISVAHVSESTSVRKRKYPKAQVSESISVVKTIVVKYKSHAFILKIDKF